MVGEDGAQERIALGAIIILLQSLVFFSPVISPMYTHADGLLRRLSLYLGCGESRRSRKSTERCQKYTTFNALESDRDTLPAPFPRCLTTEPGQEINDASRYPLRNTFDGNAKTFATVHLRSQSGEIAGVYRRKSSIIGNLLEAQYDDTSEVICSGQPTIAL